MTATELLQSLQDQGVRLIPKGDRLRIEAPKGAITTEIRTQLIEQKAALLTLLSCRDAPEELQLPEQKDTASSSPEITDRCTRCEASVEYYSDRGEAFCRTHRYLVSNQQRKLFPSLLRISQADFFQLDVAEIAGELCSSPQMVAIDLETTGLDAWNDRVISIALGISGKVAVLDLRPYYSLTQQWQEQWKMALRQLFQHPGITWVGHNLKFDWTFLAVHFGVRIHQVYDTMLVEKLIHAGEQVAVSLQATAHRYRLTVSKEEREWFPKLDQRPKEWIAPFPAKQLAYILQDIELPLTIIAKQAPHIKQLELECVVTLENEALPALAALEVHGICIDTARWRDVLKQKSQRQQLLEAQVCQVFSEALAQEYKHIHNNVQLDLFSGQRPSMQINLSNRAQTLKAFALLGVRINSLSVGALEPLRQVHPIVPIYIELLGLKKFTSSFGENLLQRVAKDGRIHATFDQLGAASGRIVGRDPNLQQIPKARAGEQEEDIRQCFVAPPGYKLLTADLPNIELRILAEVSRDSAMLRLFAEGKDLHAETARLMFGLGPEVDTKKHLVNGLRVRDIAKQCNFGLTYGMGAASFALRLGSDFKTAQAMKDAYFTAYHGAKKYLQAAGRKGITQGYAISLSGRRRSFPAPDDPDLQGRIVNAAKNHPIQGTNADILKRALALLYNRLPPEVHIVLTVHDELVLEAPDTLVDTAAVILKQAMVQACWDFLKVVHIPEPDVLIASSWQKD